MDKMLYFAKILAETIRETNEKFADLGDSLLCLTSAYDMLWDTKLRLKGNKYLILDELTEDLDLELLRRYVEEDDRELADYVDDDDDLDKLEGILLGNEFLYEVIYDYGMLGDKFGQEEKNEAVKEFLRTIYKLTNAFELDLWFMDGRIYLSSENDHSEDGAFICKTMAEVETVCQLKKGESLEDVRACSGMSEEEFKEFLERLEK